MKKLIIALVLLSTSSLSAQLLVPDSGAGDRVMMFDSFNGSLINANWLTDAGAVGWFFTTPKEARLVGNEFWVSDQVADAVHRFDLNRNFLGSVTAHPNGGTLDNVRGFGWDGNTAYVTLFHGTSALRGVAKYNAAGTPVGFNSQTATAHSYFDAEPHLGSLLISNSATSNIERYSLTGTFMGNFATGFGTPQQVEIMPDLSVITSSSIAASGSEGIYHFNSDGTLRRYIDTEPMKLAFGEQVPRGAYVLGDGNYLITASDGVFKYNVAGNSFSEILGGVDAQYIAPIPEPGTLALLCTGLLVVARRRRARN